MLASCRAFWASVSLFVHSEGRTRKIPRIRSRVLMPVNISETSSTNKVHLLIKFTCIYISEQDPFHKRVLTRPWEVLNSPEIFTRLVMKIKTLQKLS